MPRDVVMTDAMLDAGEKAFAEEGGVERGTRALCMGIYTAMEIERLRRRRPRVRPPKLPSDESISNIAHPAPEAADRIEALPCVESSKVGPPTARCETGELYVSFAASDADRLHAAVAKYAEQRGAGTLYWRYPDRVEVRDVRPCEPWAVVDSEQHCGRMPGPIGAYTRLVISAAQEVLRWEPGTGTDGRGEFVTIGGGDAA